MREQREQSAHPMLNVRKLTLRSGLWTLPKPICQPLKILIDSGLENLASRVVITWCRRSPRTVRGDRTTGRGPGGGVCASRRRVGMEGRWKDAGRGGGPMLVVEPEGRMSFSGRGRANLRVPVSDAELARLRFCALMV